MEEIGNEGTATERESSLWASSQQFQGETEKSCHIWSVVLLSTFPIPMWESRNIQLQFELWTCKN